MTNNLKMINRLTDLIKEIDNINRILATAKHYIEKCDWVMCNLIFNVKLKHLDY